MVDLNSGLEELIEEKTGINTMTAEDPLTAVAIGTGKYIEYLADDDKKLKEQIIIRDSKRPGWQFILALIHVIL